MCDCGRRGRNPVPSSTDSWAMSPQAARHSSAAIHRGRGRVIGEVFMHCAKAFRRSRLWDPTQHQDRKAMPSLLKMILDQTTGAPADAAEMQRIDQGLEEDYRTSMY